MTRGTVCAGALSLLFPVCTSCPVLCTRHGSISMLSVTLFVCTNASKINVTRKMVPITGGSRLFLLDFSKTQ